MGFFVTAYFDCYTLSATRVFTRETLFLDDIARAIDDQIHAFTHTVWPPHGTRHRPDLRVDDSATRVSAKPRRAPTCSTSSATGLVTSECPPSGAAEGQWRCGGSRRDLNFALGRLHSRQQRQKEKSGVPASINAVGQTPGRALLLLNTGA